LDKFRRNYRTNCTLCWKSFTENWNLQNYIPRFIDLSAVFPAYGLVPINYINRIRFTIAFLRCLCLPAISFFTHWAECIKRIYRKRLFSLHFILHRGRKPFFYFFRSCLAFIWLAWHYHTLFYFTVDISINNVAYCIERKGYRRRALMGRRSRATMCHSIQTSSG